MPSAHSVWLAIAVTYLALLGVASLFGAHRLALLWWRRRPAPEPPQPLPADRARWPSVTVQLPVYNEANVVARAVRAAAALEWPRERFEIQLLDDSDDATPAEALGAVRSARNRGTRIVHLRRARRDGWKAGALAAGLERARGEFVLVLDADFVPDPDFLVRTVPHLAAPSAARIGMVQARWGHLNEERSPLTRSQALMLDAHFSIEHAARNRSGRFFNFNGTAGVWRRDAIRDAGGWQGDTLTEDLDLSYRAQMRGWRFLYLDDVVCPAELPSDIRAFKIQQQRWARGAAQTARKLLPALLASSVPGSVKVEAAMHLLGNAGYLLLLGIALLLPLSVAAREFLGWRKLFGLDALLVLATTASVGAFYLSAQRHKGRTLSDRVSRVPAAMALGIGLAVNNASAVLAGLFDRPSEFRRTPKTGESDRPAPARRVPYPAGGPGSAALELALAAYSAIGLAVSAYFGWWGALPYQMLFFCAFAWVGGESATRTPGGYSGTIRISTRRFWSRPVSDALEAAGRRSA